MRINTEEFKPRSSGLEKIMGEIGLTAKQASRLCELDARSVASTKISRDIEGLDKKQLKEYKDNLKSLGLKFETPLTANMEQERDSLVKIRDNPTLPAGCITYLEEWYAEHAYGKRTDVQSKYTMKGHICEDEAILVIEDQLGDFGEYFEKNDKNYVNEWITGTPDVVCGIVYDAKCPWDGKTFLDSVTGPHNTLYVWQMRGYMFLTGIDQAKVCYVLLDTPADANYGEEVVFSHIPIDDRFYYFTVDRDETIEEEIKERVLLCRKWLAEYDKKINELLGK